MNEITIIQAIAIYILPVIFAVTVHEAAHGFVANYYGDKTAKMLGRLTLNPIKHIDPIGTIIVPLLLITMHASFLFGWAKPVPVTARNLKNPRRDLAIISLAGPLSNLLMAIIWAAIAKLALVLPLKSFNQPLYLMGMAGITINFILMLLNLLPLPPLDGSKILNNFLRGKAAIFYDKVEQYGFFILILLLLTGILNFILAPLFSYCFLLIRFIFQI